MPKVIETNGPAYLLTAITSVREMLEAGDIAAAKALLGEAQASAQDVVEWFQAMQADQVTLRDGLGWMR